MATGGSNPQTLAGDTLAELARKHQLAEAVIELHYDPAYARSSKKEERPILARFELGGLEDPDLDRAAGAVTEAVTRWSQAST